MHAQILRRVTVEEALHAVAEYPVRIVGAQRMPIGAALAGRVLAAGVVAPEDVPPFARSSVDGFAVLEREVRAASKDRPIRLRIAGEVRMGEAPPHSLAAGTAMRIPTGGALPDGADAVVKVEDCREHDGAVEVLGAQHAADHVTARAADIRRGAQLLREGDVLTAASLGMLAGAGIAELSVFARPRIALIVTGDELARAGKQLRPGEIRDINWISLAATLSAIGMDPCVSYARDDRASLEAIVREALASSDAVVVSGGSSVGARDYTPDVVAAAGEPGVIVHGVRARPGRPTMLGIVGQTPVIGLPGNPVSALVMLETLGRPVLQRLFGRKDVVTPVRARLSSAVERANDLDRFVPVRLTPGDGGIEATPLSGTSAQMHILGLADALVRVTPGEGELTAGSLVDALPLARANAL